MAIGEKIWEGKGKSGPGFIKSIEMDGVSSVYTWTAQMTGMGKAKGIEGNLRVTGFSKMPPKGLAAAKVREFLIQRQATWRLRRAVDLSKMMPEKNPTSGRLMELYDHVRKACLVK